MGLRYFVTGSQGQLGRCLVRALADGPAAGHGADAESLVAARDHAGLDIADPDQVSRLFEGLAALPDVLVNAAAYNAVDRCEGEGGAQARRVNGEGPGLLAELCRAHGVRLVHVSSDYVLSGQGRAPIPESAPPAPKSAYGRSKLEGERRVLAVSPEALVVRTSWVYGPGRNFVGAILRQARLRRSGSIEGPLDVVDDQRGCPTYALDLADGIRALVRAAGPGQGGVYHLCNALPPGQESREATSWWDFARAILDGAGFADLEIRRGRTADLQLPAPRPAYSVLSCGRAAALGVALRPWPQALAAYLVSQDLETTLELTDPGYWDDRQRSSA